VSLTKFLELDNKLVSRRLGSAEPTVQLLDLRREKTASEASDWSLTVKPKQGKTYILVLAIGASEYYGPNRNGDGFSEAELRRHHKTFETNAHVYRSHVNKDPKKSFGRVVRSFYNEDMHRVELVLEIDDTKAPDVASKIREGRDVAVSMGCRIKFDVCSICGNKAPSRAQYCDHAKKQLNEILDDGRIVFVDNPSPVFFDISVVWRPADKTGYMMKKVAWDGGLEFIGSSAQLAEKVATQALLSELLSKAADIDKYVEGVGFGLGETAPHTEEVSGDGKLLAGWVKNIVPKVLSNYRPVDNEDLGWLSGKKFPEVLGTLSDMGVLLTTSEFLRFLVRTLTGKDVPLGVVEKLISVQGDLLKLMAKHPELASSVMDTGLFSPREDADSEVREKAASWSRHRDWRAEGLVKLAISPAFKPDGPYDGGQMSTVPVIDEATGKTYYTTGSAIRQGKEMHELGLGAAAVGGLGLAAITNMALRGAVKDRGFRWLSAALPGAAAFAAMRPNSIQVRDDLVVPDSTSFVERTAAYIPTLAVLSAADRVGVRAYRGSRLPSDLVKLGAPHPVLGTQADFEATALALGRYLLT